MILIRFVLSSVSFFQVSLCISLGRIEHAFHDNTIEIEFNETNKNRIVLEAWKQNEVIGKSVFDVTAFGNVTINTDIKHFIYNRGPVFGVGFHVRIKIKICYAKYVTVAV